MTFSPKHPQSAIGSSAPDLPTKRTKDAAHTSHLPSEMLGRVRSKPVGRAAGQRPLAANAVIEGR